MGSVGRGLLPTRSTIKGMVTGGSIATMGEAAPPVGPSYKKAALQNLTNFGKTSADK